jgi:hypothetical protein
MLSKTTLIKQVQDDCVGYEADWQQLIRTHLAVHACKNTVGTLHRGDNSKICTQT